MADITKCAEPYCDKRTMNKCLRFTAKDNGFQSYAKFDGKHIKGKKMCEYFIQGGVGNVLVNKRNYNEYCNLGYYFSVGK